MVQNPDIQTELPIESQEDAERAIVEKLRETYERYGSLGGFFRTIRRDEQDEKCQNRRKLQREHVLAVAKCGKA